MSHLGVENIHREPPAGNPENRGVIEEAGKAFRVQSGARHQNLQVGSESGNVFNKAKQDVCVQCSLVGFIYEDHAAGRTCVKNNSGRFNSPLAQTFKTFRRNEIGPHESVPVTGQVRLGEKLPEQHAIRHVFEHGPLWRAVLKTDAVAHLKDTRSGQEWREHRNSQYVWFSPRYRASRLFPRPLWPPQTWQPPCEAACTRSSCLPVCSPENSATV